GEGSLKSRWSSDPKSSWMAIAQKMAQIAPMAAVSPSKTAGGYSSVDRTLISQRSCDNDTTILSGAYFGCIGDACGCADEANNISRNGIVKNMDHTEDSMGRSRPARSVAGGCQHSVAASRKLRDASVPDRRRTHPTRAASTAAAASGH